MASPSVQMRIEGDGRGGAAPGAGRILHKQKGLRKIAGGGGNPSTNASIPSRYQTFFHTSAESRGFNSQSARFQEQLNVNDTPGPGSYSSSLNPHTTPTSKTGRAGFTSKSHRFTRERRGRLGPGSYDPRFPPDKHDFSSSVVSRFFQKPVVTQPVDGENRRCVSPSPTTYHPSHTHTSHNHLVSAEAAFKSRTERGVLPSSSIAPSPGHYVIIDDILHPRPSAHSSVFASQSQREGICKPVKGPGPADYSPQQVSGGVPGDTDSVTSHTAAPYHRQKHFLRISAPAMPLPPLPPSPGPGHYETQVPSYSLEKKASSCVFVSSTGRWGSEVNSSYGSKPGPGTYDPVAPFRKSYLYNLQRKWI